MAWYQGIECNLENLRKLLNPTKKFHEFYKSKEFLDSIIDSNAIASKFTNEKTNQMIRYVHYQHIHNLLDALEETGLSGEIGDEKIRFRLIIGGERGFVHLLGFNEKFQIIKPYQGRGEQQAAQIASDEGIGPKIFKFSENYIVEEFIEGTELTKVYNMLKHEHIGKIIGQVYGRMHKKGISYAYYAHGSPDEGVRHIILQGELPKIVPRIIDFGISKYTIKHEDIERDFDEVKTYFKEVFNKKDAEKIEKSFKLTYTKLIGTKP